MIYSTQVYADVVLDTKIDAINRMPSFYSHGGRQFLHEFCHFVTHAIK